MNFKINLVPVRNPEVDTYQELVLDKEGDTLYVCGEVFDFSPLNEGDVLPAAAITSEHFTGTLPLVDGVLHMTLRFPFGLNAPEETRFPAPIHVTEDGPITLPPYEGEAPVMPIFNLEEPEVVQNED